MEFLVKGKANLYYFKDNGRMTGRVDIDTFSNETFGDNYLFEKKQNEIILLTKEERTNYRKVTEMAPNHGANIIVKSMNNKYIGALLFETTDCPELKATIQTMELNHKSLISFTKKYHEYVCHDNTCIEYTKDVPKKIIKWAPVLSMNYTWIKFAQSDGDFGDHKIKGDFNPSVGLLIEIRDLISHERRSIQLLSEFGKYEHSQSEPAGQLRPDKLDMKYNYLKEYIGIRYTTPHRIIRPSLQFGLIAGYRFNDESHYSNQYYYPGEYNGTIPFTKIFVGIGAGIGADIHFSKNLIVFLKTTYDYTVGGKHIGENFTYLSNLSIRTGIYL